MSRFCDYELGIELYRGERNRLTRAIHITDQNPAILKIPENDPPSPEDIIRLRYEYELLQDNDWHNILRALDWGECNGSYFISMESFDGITLAEWMAAGRKKSVSDNMGDILKIALQITDALEKIHQKNIVYKNINPNRILFDAQSGKIKLADFSHATTIHTYADFQYLNLELQDMVYLSPEQTGRMNRTVDNRSDLYALGILLFEMFSGKPPFTGSDVLEITYSHIARQAPTLHELDNRIPGVISEMVNKMLAKEPADRYQSAAGINGDLQTCFDQWKDKQAIDSFPIGIRDSTSKIRIMQKLYGRKEEINTILTSFQRVARGNSELILIEGSAGVGKTALVQEIYRPLTQQHAYFISGKFDQLLRDTPYQAISQALDSLSQLILSGNRQQLSDWREMIITALGQNVGVLFNVCSKLQLITGEQPTPSDLPAAESENRLHYVLQQFISLFAQPEHPLILFLDDMQWADTASLTIIEMLLTQLNHKCLLVIGAFRPDEIDSSHPLRLISARLRSSGVPVTSIFLSPLNEQDVTQWISDMSQSSMKNTISLAQLALQKTSGYPFYLLEYMRSLQNQGMIKYQPETHHWTWDIERIHAIPDGVNEFDLVTARIQQLEEEEIQTLRLAAAIGNTFDLATLAIVCEKSHQQTAHLLSNAISLELIVPISEMQHYISQVVLTQLDLNFGAVAHQMMYRFSHNHIQQAVYQSIPADQVEATHAHIGSLLLEKSSSTQRDSKLQDIVFHLNRAIGIIESQRKRNELARLNLLCAQKAKASSAIHEGLLYLETGISLLQDDAWQLSYELTLELHLQAAESAYLNSQFEKMEHHFQQVVHHARDPVDQARAYKIKIQSLTAQTHLQESLQTALEALSLLEIEIKSNPTQEDIGQAIQHVHQILSGREAGDLIDLPLMTDCQMLIAMKILIGMGLAAQIVSTELFILVSLKQVELSLKYGNAPDSCVAYSLYGWILCSTVEHIESGYAFGQLALRLLERHDNHEYRTVVTQIVTISALHWKEPMRSLITRLITSYQEGMENGNIDRASYTALQVGVHSFFAGFELQHVSQILRDYSAAFNSFKEQTAIQWIHIYQQAVLNLMGQSADACLLRGEIYDEHKMLPEYVKENNRTSLFLVYFFKMVLCYLHGNIEQSVDFARTANQYIDSVAGFLLVPEFHFYESLALLAIYENLPAAEQSQALKDITTNLQKFKQWSKHAPKNYQNKYTLIEAELARVRRQYGQTREYYDQAIDLSVRYEFKQEEAMACELAAAFYTKRKQSRIAHIYLQQAIQAYSQWGMLFKTRQLSQQLPDRAAVYDQISGRLDELDMKSVIKTSQAISEEIVLRKLLEKIIHILVENAGAQRGFLLLEKDGALYLEAGLENEMQPVYILQSIPLEDAREKLCVAIVNYTVHSGVPQVLASAASEGRFVTDEYIKSKRIRSVLCMPLNTRGRSIGALYLENNLLSDCFTENHVSLLGILASQAAVSIENAYIYSNLESLVEKRTEELEQTNASLLEEISERMRTEEALRQSEAGFRGIFNATALGIGLMDGEGHVIRSNPALQKMLGYSEEELRSMKYNEYTYQDDIGKNQDLILDVAEGKIETFQIEKRYIRKDGSVIWVRQTPSMVFSAEGAPLFGINIIENIQGQKELQEALLQAEKRAGLGTLAAGIAHEMNSPLQVITGTSESAIRRIEQSSGDMQELQADFNTIRRNSWRVANIVKALMTYSRASSQEFEPGNLNDVVHETLLLIEHETQKWEQTSIDIQLAQDLPLFVCDAALISQALINLLENAHDAMPLGGTIIIRTGHSQESHELFLQVEDSGSGVPINIRSRIFDPFFTTKPIGMGTGLGLSVVLGIIQSHGGRIQLSDAPRQGSIFTLYFPENLPQGAASSDGQNLGRY